MGGVVDSIMNIGSTSSADRANTAINNQAAAAQGAAQAQERALGRAVEFGQEGLASAQGFGQQAMDALNTPEQLQAFSASLQTQERALGRQAKLFDSIDPAVMAASQQALQLLQGEESKALGPLRERRKTQRQQLVDRLREQLGPGAETSTAGIQALNRFDQQTSETLSGAQQQSLSQLFGIASSGAQNRGSLNQSAQSLAGIANQRGQLTANTALGAGQLAQGGFANLMNAQGGLAAGAGSEFVGAQVRGAGELAQARTSQAQNAAIFGQITGGILGGGGGGGGLLGPTMDTAGSKINTAIFGK